MLRRIIRALQFLDGYVSGEECGMMNGGRAIWCKLRRGHIGPHAGPWHECFDDEGQSKLRRFRWRDTLGITWREYAPPPKEV